MASVFRTGTTFAIDFLYNGRRPRIRLGNATQRQAEEFRSKLEALLQADALGIPVSLEVATWLISLDTRIHKQLVRLGLTTLRINTLGELLAAWLSSLNPKTAAGGPVLAIIENLTTRFDKNTPLRRFSGATCREFKHFLTTIGNNGKPYARATVSRRLRMAKQVFAFAVRNRSITTNPFGDARGNGEVNRDKDFEVTEAIMQRILGQCANVEFRALLCLVRYGGVRCPSEVTQMTWEQVHWIRDCFTVLSPKTGRRMVPLFPKLRAEFQALWENSEWENSERDVLIFPNYQISHNQITAELRHFCVMSELKLWPRPFDNMRATCVTEWLRTYLVPNSPYSIIDVAAWAGHSPETMLKHYAQVRSEDLTSAASNVAR